MKIISNYIFKQITSTFLYITLFFISLIWLITSLRFGIWQITLAAHTRSVLDLYCLNFLTLIQRNYTEEFYNIYAEKMIWAIEANECYDYLVDYYLNKNKLEKFVFNNLSNDNEITIIKASGLNRFQLVKPAILLAIIISLFNLFLNLYLSPLSKEKFKESQKNLRENIARIAFKAGSFSDAFTDITIYVEDIIDENNFAKIFVYDQRNKDNPATYIADEAELIQKKFVNKVILKNGNRQFMDKKNSQLNIISFDKYEVNLDLLMQKEKNRLKEAEEMKLHELWDEKTLISSGKYDESQILGLKIEGHKRIINPIYCIIFTLLSLTFLLSKNFIFKSASNKIAIVLFAIFLVELLYLGLPNFLIKKPNLLPIIYIMPLLMVLFLIFFNISKNYKIPLKK